jgi:hypothetical protein
MDNDTETMLDAAMDAVSADIPGLVAEPETGGSVKEATEAVLAELTGEDEAVPGETSDAPSNGPDADTEPAAIPDGYSAPDVITEGLVTEFAVRDAEGEIEIPNIMIEYKANGKVRQDRLDQVVKLAQWGVYNEQKFAAQVEQYTETIEQTETRLAEREAQLERLLTDDEFYDNVREAYAQEASPERRAERAEEDARSARDEVKWYPIQQMGEKFHAEEIVPAMQMIAKSLHTVSEAELEQRIERTLRQYAVAGPGGRLIVPPAAYDELRQYIVEDLAPWAQATHAKRTLAQAPATPPKMAVRDPQKVASQQAKRQVGQVLRPVGGTTKPAPSAPKKTTFTTVDEAMEAAMADIQSGLLG